MMSYVGRGSSGELERAIGTSFVGKGCIEGLTTVPDEGTSEVLTV